MGDAKGWYRRGDQHPPHFDAGEVVQFVTFRLADSLPVERLAAWKHELESKQIDDETYRARVEDWLDAGRGACWLRDPRLAKLVQDALLHFDRQRYALYGWVVMPNHVHVLVMPHEGFTLSSLLQSWKSFTAKVANRLLSRKGTFWQDDYFDRYVRNERDFYARLEYIAENPVRAGLCRDCTDWQWAHPSHHRDGGL